MGIFHNGRNGKNIALIGSYSEPFPVVVKWFSSWFLVEMSLIPYFLTSKYSLLPFSSHPAAAAATATLSHLPATGLTFGPSPLPQFASVFGSWEHTPYTFSSTGVLRSAAVQPCSLQIQHSTTPSSTSSSNTAGQ